MSGGREDGENLAHDWRDKNSRCDWRRQLQRKKDLYGLGKETVV